MTPTSEPDCRRCVVIVVNPYSGARRNRRLVEDLVTSLTRRSLVARILWDPNERREALTDPDLENTTRCVVVVGGDGTIGPPIVNDARRINIGITYTHTFSTSMVNESKISYLRNRSDFPQLAVLDAIPSVVTGIDPLGLSFGQTSALPQFFTDRQFQVQDHLSFIKGVHSFRAGGEYRRTFNASAFEATKNGLFEPHGEALNEIGRAHV